MHPLRRLARAAAQGDIETLTLIQNLYRLRDGNPVMNSSMLAKLEQLALVTKK